jgi:hypothetical protein
MRFPSLAAAALAALVLGSACHSKPSGSFACGATACDAAAAVCVSSYTEPAGGAGGGGATGGAGSGESCAAYPTDCASSPSCDCLVASVGSGPLAGFVCTSDETVQCCTESGSGFVLNLEVP